MTDIEGGEGIEWPAWVWVHFHSLEHTPTFVLCLVGFDADGDLAVLDMDQTQRMVLN